MKKPNKTIKKFVVSNGVRFLSLAICLLCSIAYIFASKNSETSVYLDILKDALIVIVSIFGTNLLLSVLIEPHSKNAMFTDFMANDIIASPEFYGNLTEENQSKLFDALSLKVALDGSVDLLQMSKSIQQKLVSSKKEYYFEKCDYTVSIHDKGTFFEKVITRSVTLCPYIEGTRIHNYNFMTMQSAKVEGLEPLVWDNIRINGKDINKDDVVVKEISAPDSLGEQNGYNFRKEYRYKNSFKLSKEPRKLTTIVLNYTVRCPKSDVIATYRCAAPCKNFSVKCSISPEDKYKLYASAFGFIDDANRAPNNKRDNEVCVCFNDWTFNDDGVCITIYEKK